MADDERDQAAFGLQTAAGRRQPLHTWVGEVPAEAKEEDAAIPDEQFDTMLERAEKRWAGLLQRLAR